MTDVVLDGTVFAECEKMGSNRSGMHRVAEDITRNIINGNDLQISFANSEISNEHFLQSFLTKNYPALINKILPKKPLQNIPKIRVLIRKFYNRYSLQLLSKALTNKSVFHSFYYPIPEFIQKNKIKKSLTLLDIISLKINGYSDELKTTTQKIVESIVLNYGISISQFSKDDLIDYDNRVDPSRVFVVPLAASRELFYPNKNINDWNIVKKKYGLPDNYFLTVSSNDPRKNIPHLIKSFSKFILQQKPNDLYLVLTGNSTYNYTLLDELGVSKEVKQRIIIPSKYIDNEDLSVIYSNAQCFFFMSLYEGFGLPVLEAMQCGTPVITANTTSLPEVVGDAGIMLSPVDEDALCEMMNKMYADSKLRNKYSIAGLQRAELFSWQRCANEYAAIFKKISQNN